MFIHTGLYPVVETLMWDNRKVTEHAKMRKKGQQGLVTNEILCLCHQ